MHHEQSPGPADRPETRERELAPADTLFVRLRHQTALIAAASALEERAGDPVSARWARLLRDYALASDRVVSVDGDAEAATLGWLKPRGIVSLLVTEDCSDEHAVEHLIAALSAMNAVTLTVDEQRSARLHGLIELLARLLPDAFEELPVGRDARYPSGAMVAVLAPGALLRTWTPPLTLAGPARDDDDRLELLTLYGRVRQLHVPPV